MNRQQIQILQSVYDEIIAYADDNSTVEVGGVLTGKIDNDVIAGFIPSYSTDCSAFSLMSNPHDEQPVLNRMYVRFDHDTVGYTHTHPVGPLFFSRTDKCSGYDLYKQTRMHNGTSPIMGLLAWDTQKEKWIMKLARVSSTLGICHFHSVDYIIIPDDSWAARNALRPCFPLTDRDQRIGQELTKLRVLYGDTLRVFQTCDCIDVDIQFASGTLRIRMGAHYPLLPPRFWYIDASNIQYDVRHSWQSSWSDTMFLWEMVECRDQFLSPPWETTSVCSEGANSDGD